MLTLDLFAVTNVLVLTDENIFSYRIYMHLVIYYCIIYVSY